MFLWRFLFHIFLTEVFAENTNFISEGCADGWLLFSSSAGCLCYRTYNSSKDYKTWERARAECESNNATLAMFKTLDQVNFLRSKRLITYFDPNFYWIGSRNVNATDRYNWLDGTPVDTISLLKQDPFLKSLATGCMLIHSTPKQIYYKYEKCHFGHAFLCEKQTSCQHCTSAGFVFDYSMHQISSEAKVLTLRDCQKLCSIHNSNKCSALAFVQHNTTCYLLYRIDSFYYLTENNAARTVSKNVKFQICNYVFEQGSSLENQLQQKPKMPKGLTFAMLKGFTFDGPNAGTVENTTSWEKCSEICTSFPTCIAFSHNRQEVKCVLKRSLQLGHRNFNYDSGVLVPEQEIVNVSDVQVTFNETNVTSIPMVVDFQTCKYLCQKYLCIGFYFENNKHNCDLYYKTSIKFLKTTKNTNTLLYQPANNCSKPLAGRSFNVDPIAATEFGFTLDQCCNELCKLKKCTGLTFQSEKSSGKFGGKCQFYQSYSFMVNFPKASGAYFKQGRINCFIGSGSSEGNIVKGIVTCTVDYCETGILGHPDFPSLNTYIAKCPESGRPCVHSGCRNISMGGGSVYKQCCCDTNLYDNKVYVAIDPQITNTDYLQQDISNITDWCSHSQMTLQPTKCSVLHTGNSNPKKDYTINDVILPAVSQVRDLGIIVNQSLSVSPHIDHIVKSARTAAILIYRVFFTANQKFLMQMFTVEPPYSLKHIGGFFIPIYRNAYWRLFFPIYWRIVLILWRKNSDKKPLILLESSISDISEVLVSVRNLQFQSEKSF